MTRRIEPVALVGPAGPLEAQLMVPEARRPGAALVCHPHPQQGGTLHTKAVYATARALAALGLLVLRFNFRGVGRSAGQYTGGPGERDDARSALDWLESRASGEPLLVGGFSFGSWVGLEVGSARDSVVGLLGIAPPLAAYDFGFLQHGSKPVLCVAGDRDPFCPPEALAALAARLGPRMRVEVLAGAEHLLTTHLEPLTTAVQRFAAACLDPQAAG